MNEYNDPNAFDHIVNHNFAATPQASPPARPAQPYADPYPYGPPAAHHPGPAKTGLTKRGRTALALGATVLATGTFLTWQHYDAEAAAHQAKAQELALQRDQIALEMQKELNKATATSQKTQTAAEKNRQKQIDSCVSDNKGLVGKQLGTTLSSVISDCQAQYPAPGTGTNAMQEAASTTDASSADISVTSGLAIAGGVLVLGLYGASRRSRTTTDNHSA